jgi:hypothetical protein
MPGSRVARLLRLSAAEGLELAESVVLAGVCETALRWLSFGRVARVIGGLSYEPRRGERRRVPAEAFARLERVAGIPYRRSGGGTCLRESLVFFLMLKRRRVAATLRIGVRNDRHGFAAHAWVTRDGDAGPADDPVGGDRARDACGAFVPLLPYPLSRNARSST